MSKTFETNKAALAAMIADAGAVVLDAACGTGAVVPATGDAVAHRKELEGFERFLTVHEDVTLVRFAGENEIKLVARRKAKDGCPRTLFEIDIDKKGKIASVFRDSTLLFQVRGFASGYSRVEKMAISALHRWFEDQHPSGSRRKRLRKAKLTAQIESAK